MEKGGSGCGRKSLVGGSRNHYENLLLKKDVEEEDTPLLLKLCADHS